MPHGRGKSGPASFFSPLGGTALAFTWFADGVKRLGAARASVFVNLVPVFAVLQAAVLLDERLALPVLGGGLLVIAGVWLTANFSEKSSMILTQEQEMIREAMRTFAQERLAPFAGEWDRNHTFPAAALKELGCTWRARYGRSGRMGRGRHGLHVAGPDPGRNRRRRRRYLDHRQRSRIPWPAASR